MPKLISLWAFLILTLFLSACAVSAQTNTPAQDYISPTNHISDYYKRPPSDQAYELIDRFPKQQCEEMKAKAVEIHNAYIRALETQFNSNEVPYSYDVAIIGEYLYIKSYGCHQDLKNPGQDVVVLGLDPKVRIEEYKKEERRTPARSRTYVFFDEDRNIVRWGRSW